VKSSESDDSARSANSLSPAGLAIASSRGSISGRRRDAMGCWLSYAALPPKRRKLGVRIPTRRSTDARATSTHRFRFDVVAAYDRRVPARRNGAVHAFRHVAPAARRGFHPLRPSERVSSPTTAICSDAPRQWSSFAPSDSQRARALASLPASGALRPLAPLHPSPAGLSRRPWVTHGHAGCRILCSPRRPRLPHRNDAGPRSQGTNPERSVAFSRSFVAHHARCVSSTRASQKMSS